MMLAGYLLRLVTLCSEEQCGQDAIEWAVLSSWIHLTYDLETDLRSIMGEPNTPGTGRYSDIIEAYQRVCRDYHEETLMNGYL